MIYLTAQPHDPYFQWQIEVQITNFRKFGISNNMQILVWYPSNSIQLDNWKIIQQKYPEVKIFLYEDKGVNLSLYIPQLRPHILKQHFTKYPELSKEVIFYHDSDIIFNFLPSFKDLEKGDICWQSNTSSYLDYSYLERKEKEGNIPNNEAIKKMAEIGQISVDVIKKYDKNTGGAQYILRNIDSTFWDDVEKMSLLIRENFFYSVPSSFNRKYFKSENEGFQSWTADMWAVNFSLWKRKMITQITDKLDFSWGTDSIQTFNKKPIFHNAGVTKQNSDLFYKGDYINKSPFIVHPKLPPITTASRKYVEAIYDVINK